MDRRRVAILVFPGFQSLDAVGPFEVFAAANRFADEAAAQKAEERTKPRARRPWRYDPKLVSLDGGTVEAASGLTYTTETLGRPAGIDTLIIAGGGGVDVARQNSALLAWIGEVAGSAERAATVCTGTFLAASADLLEGRRVTTHWSRADELAEEFPGIEVDADPIYIQDGNFWSSAGVTAGIDLSLALVEADLGTEVAQTVARWLVMFMHRPGGQTQFAEPVWTPRAERSAVRSIQESVESAPGDDYSLARMADSACMSVRHFARVFRDEVGETPGRYVEKVRVEAARRQLEESNLATEVIADRCGLGSAETLRRVFHKHLGVAPDAYRQRFRRPHETTA